MEDKHPLAGQLVLITGAGGGIGLETAKFLVQMGARVIVLDIDGDKGNQAERLLNRLVPDSAAFYQIDLACEQSILVMKEHILNRYGCPDILFYNAAVLHLGDVGAVTSREWDHSYLVNLKAPVLLVTCFLEPMKRRGSGTFVFVSSSGAVAHMGAYEIFKTAQAELSNTLSMELEGTGLYAYTISPGLVKTETAVKSIEAVAARMDLSMDEFYRMNQKHILEIRDAALGFALSVLNAERYHGQEIGSIQVLHEMEPSDGAGQACDAGLLKKIIRTYEEQYAGWKERNIFERQWVLRDFRKSVGKSADEVHLQMKALEESQGVLSAGDIQLLDALRDYWQHQYQLLQGFEKNKDRLLENGRIIQEWISDIERCVGRGKA